MTNRVAETFERALGEILARVSAFEERASEPKMAVAYSGGLDSSVLLALAHDYAARHHIELIALHVHHGLSPNADRWLAHCASECERLGVAFDMRRIAIGRRDKGSVEQTARIGRYAALGEMCRAHRSPLLLTAHHEDDQAETIMLRLLRGSGLAGLSGMEATSVAPDLLGGRTPMLARPLLELRRAELEAAAAAGSVAYIEDESNEDIRYARNALRHQVMPLLARHFPGFQTCMARAAGHAQAGQRLLDELAKKDFVAGSHGDALDVERLKSLGSDRADNLLRYWIGLRRVQMPSSARLAEMRRQLLDSREDAQVCVVHDGHCIRRYRGSAFLLPWADEDSTDLPPLSFRWNGEPSMRFEPYRGTLYFEHADEGADADWLRDHELTIRLRRGGERMRLAANRSTRDLKHHYQELGVPAWRRKGLPLIVVGDRILFAAEIGMDCRCFGTGERPKIRLRWHEHSM